MALSEKSSAGDPDKARQVEILISVLLRVGVVASFIVIVVGMGITFFHHSEYFKSSAELQRLTKPGAAFPHGLKQTLQGIREFHGRAIVVAGLLLLIATPVMRVAVSIFAFVYEKDKIFVIATSIVLALLILSFFVGSL